ncbi:MAG TPA: metalloregulator ArsR/SmtB family transcription factor [Cellulomonas sp.]
MLTSPSRLDVMTRLGRAMSDPSRARILAALTTGPAYPARLADDLAMTRSNVSNHLACLRGCGLVVAELEGRRTRYVIADPHLAVALTALVEVVLAVDEGEPCAAESCDVPGCCADCAAGPAAAAGPALPVALAVPVTPVPAGDRA